LDARGELILEESPDRKWLRERHVTRELLGVELGDEREQRERVSLRLGNEPRGDLGVDRARDVLEHLPQIRIRERRNLEAWERVEHCERGSAVAHAEEHRDAIGVQPATDERQDACRLGIDPLCVVDDEEQRGFA
jgi:hypothetical protein